MRVAVLHPERTEPDGTVVPVSTAAFRIGRIEDYVNPLTGETTPAAEVAEQLLQQAKDEFPDAEMSIEHLVDNGDGTSRWVHEDHVEEGMVKPGGGVVAAKDISAEQTQEAS